MKIKLSSNENAVLIFIHKIFPKMEPEFFSNMIVVYRFIKNIKKIETIFRKQLPLIFFHFPF